MAFHFLIHRLLKKIGLIIVYVISVGVALGSILSLLRNSENRFIIMLDFPSIQLFLLSALCILIVLIILKKWKLYNSLLMVGFFIGLAINGIILIHYTPLAEVDVPWANTLKSSDQQFSLLLSNVKMSNRNAEPLLKLIQEKKPDMILAMEVDEWWDNALRVNADEYPYSQHTINEFAYGMVLYSKFPLETVNVEYLNNKKVPSFKSTISLPNGNFITFHSVHPVPPTYFKKLPDNEGQQAKALDYLGHEIEHRKYPTLVAGDLNDVVWSYVDDLTNTKNILHDVRVGRGFYNSYNAHNIFMRWPLDHVFVTEEFQVEKLERLSKIGSDHFPIYVELVLVN